jgi:hypothetical protein
MHAVQESEFNSGRTARHPPSAQPDFVRSAGWFLMGRAGLLASLLLLGATPLVAAEPTAGELLKLIPDTVNAVVVVRVKDLTNTPRGQRENWAKKHETEFLAGSLHIPPTVDTLVRGVSFHLEDVGSPLVYSVASWQRMSSIGDLAKREGTEVEWIGPVPTVRMSRGALVAEILPGVTGLIRPGFRQEMARWIARCERKDNPAAAAYFTEAINDETSQILMAFDTRDMFEPKVVRARLARMQSMAGIAAHLETMSKLIEQLRGVRLQIRVEEKATARLSLDFAADVPKGIGEFFRPFLTEFFGDAGAYIEELETAKVEVGTQSVTLVMDLSDSSLRRVLSLLISPSPSASEADATPMPPTPDTAVRPAPRTAGQNDSANQAYFTAVYQSLADLEVMNRKAKDYTKTATWHDNYSRKIDQLPTRGVDQELLDYGADVASKLRSLAASLRGVPLQMNRLQNSITYDVKYDPGWVAGSWWGGAGYRPSTYNVQTNAGQIRAEQAAAVAKGAEQREEIWKLLADQTAGIRRRMLDKSNIELQIPAPKK